MPYNPSSARAASVVESSASWPKERCSAGTGWNSRSVGAPAVNAELTRSAWANSTSDDTTSAFVANASVRSRSTLAERRGVAHDLRKSTVVRVCLGLLGGPVPRQIQEHLEHTLGGHRAPREQRIDERDVAVQHEGQQERPRLAHRARRVHEAALTETSSRTPAHRASARDRDRPATRLRLPRPAARTPGESTERTRSSTETGVDPRISSSALSIGPTPTRGTFTSATAATCRGAA